MIRPFAAIALALLLPLSAHAQATEDALDFGGDAYRAGGTVAFATPGARDVFLTGERVDLTAPVEGSAHLAGRRVSVEGAVGGDLYAIGADVRVAGPVAGSASLAGYDIELLAAVGGNLRATGSQIDVKGAVGGAALIAGSEVAIAAAIAGDASVTAETLTWGEGARVDGRLTLFQPDGVTFEVPASVAPPERIERREIEDGPMIGHLVGPGWFAIVAGLVFGVLLLAVLAALAPTLAPGKVARLREIVGHGPFRALGAGFLTQSALIGAAIVLAITVIGLVLAPFAVLLAVLLGILGYIVAVYLLGAWAVTRAGALEPDTFPEYALAGLVGAVIATLLSLIPLLGWFVILALTFVGVGAIAIATFGRRHA